MILGGKYYVPEVAIGYSMAFPSEFCPKAYELLYVTIHVCVCYVHSYVILLLSFVLGNTLYSSNRLSSLIASCPLPEKPS